VEDQTVVCYEMAGQIKNTLRSLLPSYPRNIATEDYEITLMIMALPECCRYERARAQHSGSR
jgi:hypothetical protein